MKTFKTIRKVIRWVVWSAIIIGGIFIYMAITHPYMLMNMFDGSSQQQVEKEWNQPITPSTCYHADCRN